MLEVPPSAVKCFVYLANDDAVIRASVWAFVQSFADVLRNVDIHNVYLKKRNLAFEGADTTPPPRYHTTTLKVFRERSRQRQ